MKGRNRVKNRLITGVPFIILGLLIAIGPQTLFKVCAHTEKIMKCYWTSRAEIGIGALILISGILIIASKSREARISVSILTLFTSIFAILVPAVLIGGCGMDTMACRSTTFPALYVLNSISIIISILNVIYLSKVSEKVISLHE
jgi:hypothetical protein